MILVDSSVWIDYFRGTSTPQSDMLDQLLAREAVCVGDLILAEVLQGFRRDEQYRPARRLMLSFQTVELGGREIALKAAQNHRALRRAGITARKTIDTIIATHCIENGFHLLHSDRDFEPFVTHLGLKPALESRPLSH